MGYQITSIDKNQSSGAIEVSYNKAGNMFTHAFAQKFKAAFGYNPTLSIPLNTDYTYWVNGTAYATGHILLDLLTAPGVFINSVSYVTEIIGTKLHILSADDYSKL